MATPIDYEAELLSLYRDWNTTRILNSKTKDALHSAMLSAGVYTNFHELMERIREQQQTPEEKLYELLRRASIRPGTTTVTLSTATPADAKALQDVLVAIRKAATGAE